MFPVESEEKSESSVFSLSQLRYQSETEFARRAEKLKLVQDELDKRTVMRDIELSVRIGVDSEDRVCLGSSVSMLCLVSDYFSALFEGDSALERGETIELSERVTMAGMCAINALAFGALSEVRVTSDNLAQLMTAAQYCKVASLTELCNEFIIRKDIFNDISVIAKLIVDLNQLGFTQQSDEWMDKVPREAFARLFLDDSSLRMSFDLFSSLVSSDALCLSEEKVWQRCVEWAVYQATQSDCDVLEYLKDLKPLIRFTLLSEEFLMKNVFKTRLLSLEEFTVISGVKHGVLDKSELFCKMGDRNGEVSLDTKWDSECVMDLCHVISEKGLLLSHIGRNGWANAMVTGVILGGTAMIEFEQLTIFHAMFGVITSSQTPKLGDQFGNNVVGVGIYGRNGDLHTPLDTQSFGEKISEGDRIKVVLKYTDSSHAVLRFHRNGEILGHAVQLDDIMDVSRGLRFAVQTYYKGTNIRIAQVVDHLV